MEAHARRVNEQRRISRSPAKLMTPQQLQGWIQMPKRAKGGTRTHPKLVGSSIPLVKSDAGVKR